MTTSSQSGSIEQILEQAVQAARSEACTPAKAAIDTRCLLLDLAAKWPNLCESEQLDALNGLCRKLAVARKLMAGYDRGYKKAGACAEVSPGTYALAVAVLLAWSQLPEQLGKCEAGMALKLLNAALSAADLCPHMPHALGRELESRVQALEPPVQAHQTVGNTSKLDNAAATCTLPLSVLAYEGPCLRAYLAMMRRAGLRPQRIMLLVLSEHPRSRRPVGAWLPGRLRRWYAAKAQDHALNFWPRRIRSSHPELVRSILAGLEPIVAKPGDLIDEMYAPMRYEDYADEVLPVMVRNLQDDALLELPGMVGDTAILFTGGGILPRKLIDLAGMQFLHVHPGHLPWVRGADGLLWSSLIEGRPAASCFWLTGGLDTGDILAVRDYPQPGFKLQGPRPDDRTLYRAIFSFVDPLMRADLLVRDVLTAGCDPRRNQSTPQDPADGVTYHFMHTRLRSLVLEKLFRGA